MQFFCAPSDVKEESIDLADESLKFKGKSENKEYEVDISFLKSVDAEGSTYKVLPRSVQMHVMKKDKEEEEFWPRLLKDKALEKNQVSNIHNFDIFFDILVYCVEADTLNFSSPSAIFSPGKNRLGQIR